MSSVHLIISSRSQINGNTDVPNALFPSHISYFPFTATTLHLGFLIHVLFSSTSRDIFNKYQAQRWWTENYDKVMELYNVQRLNRQAFPLPTPPRSEDEVIKVKPQFLLLKTWLQTVPFLAPSEKMIESHLYGRDLSLFKRLA